MAKRMSLKVSDEMYNFISEQAETRSLTMNSVVVLALETYYERMMVMPNLPKIMEMYEQIQEEEKQKKEGGA